METVPNVPWRSFQRAAAIKKNNPPAEQVKAPKGTKTKKVKRS